VQQGQVNPILEIQLWCDTEWSLPFSPNLARLNVWLASIHYRITVFFAPVEVLVRWHTVKWSARDFCVIIHTVMCVWCVIVFKNVEIRFPVNHNEINSIPSYVHILLASRITSYNKVVCTVKHMLSLMLSWEYYFMTLCKACTMMASDFYVRNVFWVDTQGTVFFTCNF
jgi:hypothetical protein